MWRYVLRFLSVLRVLHLTQKGEREYTDYTGTHLPDKKRKFIITEKSGDGLCGKDWSQILNIRRGDIYYADLSPVVGSEQGGMRPVLIVQNDVGNKYSPTVIAAAITSKMSKTRLPTHIDIYAERAGLQKDSVILLEQIRTIDKKRLGERMGHLDDATMGEVNHAITISFGLGAE